MTGFCGGTFELFHAGHVLMLQEAKTVCDYLIVGILIDPTVDRPDKNKPIQSIIERQIQVAGCKYVDEIIVYENEKQLGELLNALDIDIRIMGADYKHSPITGGDICKARGIDLYFTRRDHDYSSSNLRRRIK